MFKGFTYFVKFAWKRQKSFLIYSLVAKIGKEIDPLIDILLMKFLIDAVVYSKDVNIILKYVMIYTLFDFLSRLILTRLHLKGEDSRNKLRTMAQSYICNTVANTDYKMIESDDFLNKQSLAREYLFYKGLFGYIYDTGIEVIGFIVNFIGVIIIISTLNVWVTILLVIIVLFNNLIKSSFNSKFYEISRKLQIVFRHSSYMEKLVTNREYGKELRINNIKGRFLNKFEKSNKILFDEASRERRYGYYLNISNGITTLIQNVIVLGYLGVKVFKNNITVGSFTMYYNAINQFSGSMHSVMNSIIDIKRIELNYKDFDEYMNLPQKMREGKRLSVNNPNDKHSIEFKDVWFKYPSSEKYILKNINIKIEAGEKLSVVGENGAGKTTFIKLLTRLYDPSKGDILFDGINIKDLDYDEYMKAVSVVFQDFRLFAFSIKENVTLKDDDEVSDEEVLKIIEKAGLSENMKKFDRGIHTTVYKEFDDEGVELSGGEGQKLSIARALYKNGGIVVLDEPTAALDPRSEYEIYMRFNELIQGKTAIFISHRLSSSRFCDKVAVFEDGEIKEYGTHDTLMNKNGVYAELYNKQAQFYVDVNVDEKGE